MIPTVVNKYKSTYDIYIGRGSKWGNPFVINDTNSRDDVIEKYEHYLRNKIAKGEITKEDFLQLKGKVLGCFCKPKRCHGDVIVKIYNELNK